MTHLHGITARQYDTGGRYIENDTALLPLGGSAVIRRQGNRVTCRLMNIPRSYNSVIFNIPQGFKTQSISNVGGSGKPGGPLISMCVHRGSMLSPRFNLTGASLVFHGESVADGVYSMEAEWYTIDPEPAVLPGVPDLFQPPYI